MAKQEPTPTRTHLADSPEFVAAEARLAELKAEYATLDREIDQRNRVLSEMSEGSTQRRQREAAATELLIGAASSSIAPQLLDNPVMIHRAITELHERRAIVHAAIEMQGRIVTELRYRCSAEICRELLPAHHAIVAQITEARIALARATQAERELFDDLRNEGVSLSLLRPMGDNRAGLLTSEHSHVRNYLRECVAYGYAVPDLPEVPRDSLLPPRFGFADELAKRPTPSLVERASGWLAAATG